VKHVLEAARAAGLRVFFMRHTYRRRCADGPDSIAEGYYGRRP
jgi:hypothetical protein